MTWFGYVFDVVAESSVQSSTCTLWVHFEAGYKHEQWDEFIVKKWYTVNGDDITVSYFKVGHKKLL